MADAGASIELSSFVQTMTEVASGSPDATPSANGAGPSNAGASIGTGWVVVVGAGAGVVGACVVVGADVVGVGSATDSGELVHAAAVKPKPAASSSRRVSVTRSC